MSGAEIIILFFAICGYTVSAALLIEKEIFVNALEKFFKYKNLILFIGILEVVGGLLIISLTFGFTLVGVISAVCGALLFSEGIFLLFLYEDYKISLILFLCNDKKIMITTAITILISTFFLYTLVV